MGIAHVSIIGVGGVGGFFGGKLCRILPASENLHVSFVARGQHLRAIQDSGLQLTTEAEGTLTCRPSLATDDFGALPPPDLCLLCVKAFDLPQVLHQLRPLVRHDTLILPLLNGVDVDHRVRAVIRSGIVLPACVYVGTHIATPGCVHQRGGGGRILVGPDPLRPDFDPTGLLDLLKRASIGVEWTPAVRSEIWMKFLFICPFGLVSAVHSKTLGEIMSDDALRGEVLRVTREVEAVARHLGIPLPDDIAEQSVAKAGRFPPEAKTSFQRDFERTDRPDERDLFVGTMTRLALEQGVAIPATLALGERLAAMKPIPTDSSARHA